MENSQPQQSGVESSTPQFTMESAFRINDSVMQKAFNEGSKQGLTSGPTTVPNNQGLGKLSDAQTLYDKNEVTKLKAGQITVEQIMQNKDISIGLKKALVASV